MGKGVSNKNMAYNYEKVLVQKFDTHVALLTLNNPPLNMNTLQTSRDLYDCLRELDRDDDVRAIVITGMGDRAYSVGSDIKEFPSVWDDVVDKKIKKESEAFNQLEMISKPTIAAVEGFCLGGGCEMVTCADMRIAAETAKFGTPEVTLGVVPCSGAMFHLPKLIGLGRAYEMMYLGEQITAQRAYEIGLVNRVVPEGKAVEAALEIAAKIAEKSDVAVRAIKRYAREMMEESSSGNFYKNLELAHLVFHTAETQEGVAAFFEKRKPDFHKHKK